MIYRTTVYCAVLGFALQLGGCQAFSRHASDQLADPARLLNRETIAGMIAQVPWGVLCHGSCHVVLLDSTVRAVGIEGQEPRGEVIHVLTPGERERVRIPGTALVWGRYAQIVGADTTIVFISWQGSEQSPTNRFFVQMLPPGGGFSTSYAFRIEHSQGRWVVRYDGQYQG